MGAWQQTAPLPNALYGTCAVYHPDQDKVYVFGGRTSVGAIGGQNRTTYILDPDTNTWSAGALMPGAGGTTTEMAFVAPDGNIHVLNVAGYHYRYDPDTNTWDMRTGIGSTIRSWIGFQDASGRIIVTFGASPRTVRRYDPATDAWTALPDGPVSDASQGSGTAGVLGADGKLYSGGNGRELIRYDPAVPAWSRTPASPLTGFDGWLVPISRLLDGRILRLPMLALDTAMKRIDGYDPATNAWTMGVIPDFIGEPSRNYAVATDVDGARIWIVGGYRGNPLAESFMYLQNRPPTAATLLTLTGDALVSTAVKNRARHQFNDPDVGDSQSKFEWRHRLTGVGAAWTTGTVDLPTPWYDIDAGDLEAGQYERQVRTYDAAGEPAPWTASGFFTAADPPAGATILYPVNGQLLEQQEYVEWSAAVQQSYQVRRVADDGDGNPVADPTGPDVYFDTGEVVDALTRRIALTFETNGRPEHVQVRVKAGGIWQVEWTSVAGDVSYTPPPTPSYVLYPDPARASLLLMISTPEPEEGDPAAVSVDVWIDDGAGEKLKGPDVATNGPWRYPTPVSKRDYSAGSIRVVAKAANGATASSES